MVSSRLSSEHRRRNGMNANAVQDSGIANGGLPGCDTRSWTQCPRLHRPMDTILQGEVRPLAEMAGLSTCQYRRHTLLRATSAGAQKRCCTIHYRRKPHVLPHRCGRGHHPDRELPVKRTRNISSPSLPVRFLSICQDRLRTVQSCSCMANYTRQYTRRWGKAERTRRSGYKTLVEAEVGSSPTIVRIVSACLALCGKNRFLRKYCRN